MDHASYQTAARGLRETGASVQERELVELLSRHGREEGALLERYQRFAQEAASPATRYLVNLIVEDEQRHHRLLGEIANAIAWGMLTSAAPAVPTVTVDEHDATLLAETKALLSAEKQDRDELRRMQRRFRGYAQTTLWPLLLDLMLADTEKHAQILSFVAKHNAG